MAGLNRARVSLTSYQSWTLSWITPFCPTSGMSTQVFFQYPMGPLHGSRVKIRGHMIAHRTPLSPKTTKLSDGAKILPKSSTPQLDCTNDKRRTQHIVTFACTVSSFLLLVSTAMLTRNINIVILSVRPFVCPSLCLSVTLQYSMETA